MRLWRRLQRTRWYLRWPVKWAIVAVTVLVVCFPYPRVLARHLAHIRAVHTLVDPQVDALQPWVGEVRQRLSPDMPPRKVLRVVERFVYEKVPYKFDWETWGVVNYLPTVDEVIEMGSEDCDGQAVVAASILRNLGYEARLVADFAHVWVWTERGETMGPGKRKSLIVTETGVEHDWRGLLNLPKAAGFGLAVFPVLRELVVLVVIWLLLLDTRVSTARAVLGALLLLDALLLLRLGGADYDDPILWAQWIGVAHVVLVVALFAPGSHRRRERRRA